MMYGGYYGGYPGNSAYSNFGYQGPPGSLMQMQNPYINNSYLENNPLNDINNRLNELEIKVNNLEKKINKHNNQKDDDDTIYIL